MRLDPMFDSLYVLNSLWGILTGQVCTSSSGLLSSTPRVSAWSLEAEAQTAEAQTMVTAFVDVNVIPMDTETERVLEHQTVLVAGGKITALGPRAKVTVPSGAVRIDGRGKYLMPGLTDMHNHNGFDSGEYDQLAPMLLSHLAEGVTAIRYANIISGDPQAFEKADVLSPRIYIRGAYVTEGSYAPGISANNKLERPESAAAYVAAIKTAGYDFIRIDASDVYARRTLPIVDSLLVAARRLGVPVAAHDHEQSFGKTLALGTVGGSYDHLTAFRDTLGLTFAVYSDTLGPRQTDTIFSKIPALAAAAQRAGLWVTPTLDCTEATYLPAPNQVAILRKIVKALQDAGAGMLLGTDGYYASRELTALVRAGLSPYQALLTGTRNVAQQMRMLDSSGTVAVGKRADLVLLVNNPLADIRHIREPVGVMVRGRWLARADLDQRQLAAPKVWFKLAVQRSAISLSMPQEKFNELQRRFNALSDSLDMSKPVEHERALRRLADELGRIRATLTPELRDIFDPMIARVWLGEQARKGYRMTIAGVALAP